MKFWIFWLAGDTRMRRLIVVQSFFFMLLRVTVGYSRGGGSRYEDPFFAGIDLFSFQLG